MVSWKVSGVMALSVFLLVVAGCASGPAPIPRMAVEPQKYDAGFDRTWEALNDVLSEKRLPIRAFEKESGLVTTDFVDGKSRYIYRGGQDDSGQETSIWASKTQWFLNIRVRSDADGSATVDVIPHMEYMRYEYNSTLGRRVEVGWAACDSHGDIEKEIYDALDAKLRN